jgi:biotin operon repressor
MGRTFVGRARIAADLGCSPQTVSNHIAKLKALGYIENAKPLHRTLRSKSRRIIYTPRKMTEEAIRSTLRPAELMELAEAEAQIIAHAKAKVKPITAAEHGREALKARFVMLCEQYFADARAAGWWISDIQARRAALALAEQAAGCLRLDRMAAEAPSDALGYLDAPEDEMGL